MCQCAVSTKITLKSLIPLVFSLKVIVNGHEGIVTAFYYLATLNCIIDSTPVLAKMSTACISAAADVFLKFGEGIKEIVLAKKVEADEIEE